MFQSLEKEKKIRKISFDYKVDERSNCEYDKLRAESDASLWWRRLLQFDYSYETEECV